MGYDQDRFPSPFSTDLICSICLGVLEDPAECKKCQTNFCSECINLWKSKNQKCPNNCELLLNRSHRFVRSVLENLPIRCINYNSGCQQILKLEYIKNHENKECEFRKIKCKYLDCGLQFTSSEIEEHEKNCPKKIIICGECGDEVFYSNLNEHSCIASLTSRISSLTKLYENASKKLLAVQEIFKDKISKEKGEIHYGIKCEKCGMDPIIGVRNVCLECENFNLCWKCSDNHQQHSFFQLLNSEVHYRVTCDSCYESPIKGIRYKCKRCEDFGNYYLDLCHVCKIRNGHPHNDYWIWSPYKVVVTPLIPQKIGYNEGEILIREWEIFNESNQPITHLELTSVSGDTCSKLYTARAYHYSFKEFFCGPKSSAIITLKDKIFQSIPGIYKCEMAMTTNQRISQFYPILKYELAILNNF
jgi:Zinc finger, ZZ type